MNSVGIIQRQGLRPATLNFAGNKQKTIEDELQMIKSLDAIQVQNAETAKTMEKLQLVQETIKREEHRIYKKYGDYAAAPLKVMELMAEINNHPDRLSGFSKLRQKWKRWWNDLYINQNKILKHFHQKRHGDVNAALSILRSGGLVEKYNYGDEYRITPIGWDFIKEGNIEKLRGEVEEEQNKSNAEKTQ